MHGGRVGDPHGVGVPGARGLSVADVLRLAAGSSSAPAIEDAAWLQLGRQAIEALRAARTAAPQLPRGLLLDALREGWLQEAKALGCVAVVCHHSMWNAHTVGQVQASGMRCLSYTVNDPADVHRLQALGTDGIITDRVDLFRSD